MWTQRHYHDEEEITMIVMIKLTKLMALTNDHHRHKPLTKEEQALKTSYCRQGITRFSSVDQWGFRNSDQVKPKLDSIDV